MTHKEMRQKLWMDAAVACISAANCNNDQAPKRYADCVLKAFDERFPAPQQNNGQRVKWRVIK